MFAVTEAVSDFALTVNEAVAEAAAIDESPANVALTPDAYVPALMPARLLALSSVATPEEFVVAVPTEVPFRANEIVLPVTDALDESVACRLLTVLPPYVPLAFCTVTVEALTTVRGIDPLSEFE